MSRSLVDQVRLHVQAIDADQNPVDLDEIVSRVGTVGTRRPSRRVAPGWAVAVAAFAIVIILALPLLLNRDIAPVATNPGIASTTTPTSLPGVEDTLLLDTPLGIVNWTRVNGDTGSLPLERILYDPIEGIYTTVSGRWTSSDGTTWRQDGSAPDRDLASTRWGDYWQFDGRFGTRRDGVWRDIELPVPEPGTSPWVDGVAVSGDSTLASGSYWTMPDPSRITLWVSDDDEEFTGVEPPWSTFAPVFAMPEGGFGAAVDSPLDERGLWISDDGLSWTQTVPQFLIDEAAEGMEIWSVAERGGTLVAGLDYGAASGSPSHREWVSHDGVTWTPYPNPFLGLQPDSVPHVERIDGGYLAFTTWQDQVWASKDGVTWDAFPVPSGQPDLMRRGVAGDLLYQFVPNQDDTVVFWIGRFE